jgi:hypothetical protein
MVRNFVKNCGVALYLEVLPGNQSINKVLYFITLDAEKTIVLLLQ